MGVGRERQDAVLCDVQVVGSRVSFKDLVTCNALVYYLILGRSLSSKDQ